MHALVVLFAPVCSIMLASRPNSSTLSRLHLGPEVLTLTLAVAPTLYDYDNAGATCTGDGSHIGTSCGQQNGWAWDHKATGYFQVELPQAMEFVKFQLTAPGSGPEFDIKYSDDGSAWSTAATVPNGGNSVEWTTAGAHKYWRYEITGGSIKNGLGYPWFNGFNWYSAVTGDRPLRCCLQIHCSLVSCLTDLLLKAIARVLCCLTPQTMSCWYLACSLPPRHMSLCR